MEKNKKLKYPVLKHIPLIGIAIFVSLYIYAATLYPGGSQANKYSVGFDWIHNYWCNLLNDNGMNGQLNPAKPYSILAMIILCLSLMVFFIQFAQIYVKDELWKSIIKLCGILSMTSAILIFTEYHDLMTVVSSIFGIFVVIGIMREIHQKDLHSYKYSGAVCVILLILNNCIYYSKYYIEILPLLQKITFILVLFWIIGLNYKINNKSKEAHQ